MFFQSVLAVSYLCDHKLEQRKNVTLRHLPIHRDKPKRCSGASDKATKGRAVVIAHMAKGTREAAAG